LDRKESFKPQHMNRGLLYLNEPFYGLNLPQLSGTPWANIV